MLEAKYDPSKHKITKGLYGTFERSPFQDHFKERFLKRIAYYFPKTSSIPKNLIFVVGAGRSGTSIILKSIAQSKNTSFYPGEALDLWFPKSFPWSKFATKQNPPFWVSPKKFTENSNTKWTVDHEKKVVRVFSNYQKLMSRDVLIQKNAMASHQIWRMAKLFPTAKFIYIIRDGRNVGLSHAEQMYARIQENPKSYIKYNYNWPFHKILESTCIAWNEQILSYHQQFQETDLKNTGKLLCVKYEDFCTRPQQITNTISKFTGSISVDKEFLKQIRPATARYKDLLSENDIKQITNLMISGLTLHNY